MAFATYNDFRTAVLLMVDGDEVSSVIQPQTLDLMISLGEALVYTGEESGLAPLRASSMEAAFPPATTVTDNAVTLPDDLLELSAVWFDPARPLEVVTEEEVRRSQPGGGRVHKCAQAGDDLIFAPAAEDGATLEGRYYAKPAPLINGLHPTFNRYPELFLYAALYVSAPFLGIQSRLPVWQGFYARLLAQANHQERMRVYGGSRLRMKSR